MEKLTKRMEIQKHVFNIPNFVIYNGQIIDIVFEDDLEDDDKIGEARYNNNQIALQSPKNDEYCVNQIEVTYLHEVIHTILENMGYKKESNNEHLVEVLATGMYQFIIFAQYDNERNTFLENVRKKEKDEKKI